MGAYPAVESRPPGRIRRRSAPGPLLEILYPRFYTPGPDFIYTNFSGGRGLDFIYTDFSGGRALEFICINVRGFLEEESINWPN